MFVYSFLMQDIQIHNLYFQPLFSKEEIAKRVVELGKQLTIDFKDKKPLFVSILNGSFVFAADLIRAVDTELEIAFIKLSSYKGFHSTGEIEGIENFLQSIENRHVIIVDDIIDTGQTVHAFSNKLYAMNPASLSTIFFLVKPAALKFPIKIDYIGFEIPNDFVVGYGLDYDGLGRNLSGLYQLKP